MITRLESYTKDAAPRTQRRARAGQPQVRRRGESRTLGVGCHAGAVHFRIFALVLFDDMESPLLAMALMFLVAYELVQPHVRNR